MEATQRFVTASHPGVQGLISHDGRTPTSRYWSGGAAYVLMCAQCGLEPSRIGYPGNCLCMCYKCCKPVHGHGAIEWFDMGMFGREVKRVLLCEDCGGVEVCAIPIGTRECKTKRKRPHRVSPPPPVDGPAAADAAIAVAAAPAVAADIAVEHYVYYGCD